MHLTGRNPLIYGVFAFLWAAIIFKLSTMPGTQLPTINWLMAPDKFGHAAVYGIFTFLLFRAGQTFFQTVGKKRFFAAGIAILYGIGMELVQYAFFLGRYFEYSDIVANIIGVLIMLKLIDYIENYFTNK